MSAQAPIELHKSLLNKKAYSMKDVITGGAANAADGDVSSKQIVQGFENSPFYKSFKKHSKGSSDSTAGINELTSFVLEFAAPNAIGRQLARVIETQKESVKVRLPSKGVAVPTSRGFKTTSRGERESFVTLTPDKELESSDQWDTNYIEDADWDVAAGEAAETMRALKELESSIIIAYIAAITASSLASGALHSAATTNTTSWADLVDMWAKVKAEDFTPNVCAMNPLQLADLLKVEIFYNSLMLGDFVNLDTGMIGRSLLGFDVLVSSQITAGHVYMLDRNLVALYCLRRDAVMKTYELPPNESGVQVTTRYDLKTGRSKALIRMQDG